MKKILLMIMMAVPLVAMAQKDDSKYLAGAVPEHNGIVPSRSPLTVTGSFRILT